MGANDNPDPIFKRALDTELERLCSFYEGKELEIFKEVDDLLEDEKDYLDEAGRAESAYASQSNSRVLERDVKGRQQSMFDSFTFGRRLRRSSTLSGSNHAVDDTVDDDSDDDDLDETTALRSKQPKERRKTIANDSSQADDIGSPHKSRRKSGVFDDFSDQAFSALYNSGITLKKRTISLYVSLCELKSYIQLNQTGFRKALKKYDKILDRSLKSKYLKESVAPAYPFKESTMKMVEGKISKMEQIYADVVTNGDVATARRELRLHLREHVVWERNTVWREMIGIERKAQAANFGLSQSLLGVDHDPSKHQRQGDTMDESAMKELITPIGRYRLPRWLLNPALYTLIGIFAVFLVLWKVQIMEKPEQQNCLAMLVFVSLLWATEV